MQVETVISLVFICLETLKRTVDFLGCPRVDGLFSFIVYCSISWYLFYYLFSINPIIEKINPTVPIPIASSPIPDEQREIIIAKSNIAIPKPIFFIETPPSQNINLSLCFFLIEV